MKFALSTAPHLAPSKHLDELMRGVILALVPGITALVMAFGPGVLIQCTMAILTAVITEGVALRLRGRPILIRLKDYSAVLTGILLAISIPPLSPWWLIVFGTTISLIIGKHIYGGLGYNPFNPAMLGYAVLLIAFPKNMTAWGTPSELLSAIPSLQELIEIIFNPDLSHYDGLTTATPLDTTRTQLGMQRLLDDIHSQKIVAIIGGKGWQWANAGFLVGGLWLLKQRIISWPIPMSFLGALTFCSLMFHLSAPTVYPNPLFHLFTGGTMLGAFFIATDPVTAATTPKGRLIYGALIGVLVFVIRSLGGYPDGVAFAVLLMNLASPTIDHYSQPRTYGHQK